MPTKPPRFTPIGFKPRSEAERKKEFDSKRASSASRGYGSKWQKARAKYLQEFPLCAECLKEGRPVLATCVDHIIPHRGCQKLFWSRSNWQSLCASCHSRKTALYDSAFTKK